MATVSRVTEPSVQGQITPGAYVGARMDPNSLDPVIRGLNNLGGAVTKIMQQEQDKANAGQFLEGQRKLGDYERTWWDPNNQKGVYAKKGKDALGLVDAVAPDFDKVQGEIADSIKSPQARDAFLKFATGKRESMLDRVNAYAVREHDGYVNAEFEANATLTMQEAVSYGAAGDEVARDRSIQTGLMNLDAHGIAFGESAAVMSARKERFLDGVHVGVLESKVANNDVDGANSYLSAHGEEMSEAARTKAIITMKPYIEEAEAYRIADSVNYGVTAQAVGADVSVDDIWPRVEHRESRGNQAAVSNKGATGVAQVMEATGPEAAALAGLPWDRNRWKNDEDYNRTIGKAYLAQQFKVYGSMPMALAAYNGGAGSVNKWIKQNGDPRKGEISMEEWVSKIGFGETRAYVQAIMGSAPAPEAAGAVTTSTATITASGGRPQTLEEKLAVARTYPPDTRRRAEGLIRQNEQDRKVAEHDAEVATSEGISRAVETADPSTPLSKILSPAQMVFAQSKGLVDNAEERLRKRGQGTPVVTPPETQLALSDVILKAATGDATAVAYLRGLNPYTQRTWSSADQDRVANMKIALSKGDTKSMAAAATEAEITTTIGRVAANSLGIDLTRLKATKDRPADEKAVKQYNAFDNKIRTFIGNYSAQNGGKKPGYVEVQKYADSLVFQVPAIEKKEGWFLDSVKEVQVAAPLLRYETIPATHKKFIEADLTAKGKTFTQQDVLIAYMIAAKMGALPK